MSYHGMSSTFVSDLQHTQFLHVALSRDLLIRTIVGTMDIVEVVAMMTELANDQRRSVDHVVGKGEPPPPEGTGGMNVDEVGGMGSHHPLNAVQDVQIVQKFRRGLQVCVPHQGTCFSLGWAFPSSSPLLQSNAVILTSSKVNRGE